MKTKVKTKICEVCSKEFFPKVSWQRFCSKECSTVYKNEYYNKQYYKDNREELIQKEKDNYWKNPERMRVEKREYRKNNSKVLQKREKRRYNSKKRQLWIKEYLSKPEVKEKNRLRDKKRKTSLERMAWYEEYSQSLDFKERVNTYRKQKEQEDISFKIGNRLRTRIYNVLKNNYKSASTIKLLECSIEDFKNHLEELFQEGMTWENYGDWHIDHILPCSAFELQNSEEQEICFHYTNLQPLWSDENLSKSNKIIMEERI